MGTDPEKTTARSTRSGWEKTNTWLGHVVFGVPAVLAIPALITTAARFGWWQTLTTALPAAAWAGVPLLLWVVYLRRRGRGRRAAWSLLLGVAVVVLLLSPISFWAGPATAVLLLEASRGLVARRRGDRPRTRRWRRLRSRSPGTKDIARTSAHPAPQDGGPG